MLSIFQGRVQGEELASSKMAHGYMGEFINGQRGANWSLGDIGLIFSFLGTLRCGAFVMEDAALEGLDVGEEEVEGEVGALRR